jgi:hypothetical protein
MFLKTNHPSVRRVIGCLSQWINRPGRKADYWHSIIVEVQNEWSFTFSPPYIFVAHLFRKNKRCFWVHEILIGRHVISVSLCLILTSSSINVGFWSYLCVNIIIVFISFASRTVY